MYTLYYSPFACSFAVHAALKKVGIPFTLEKVDIYKNEHLSSQYLALNPNAQVPLLIHDDVAITQASAILLYLSERHPDAHLMPSMDSQDRAKALQTLFYLSNTVHPYFLRLFYPERLSTQAPEEVKALGIKNIEKALHAFNETLATQDYCISNTVFGPDYYWLAMLNWTIHHKIDLSSYQHIHSYLTKMRSRPEIQITFEKEMESLTI